MKYIAAAFSVWALTTPAQAEIQVYEFSATIGSLVSSEGASYTTTEGAAAGSVISLYDRVVGRFSYDTELAALPNAAEPVGTPASSTAPGYQQYGSRMKNANEFAFTILPSGQQMVVAADQWKSVTVTNYLPDGMFSGPDRLAIYTGESLSTTGTIEFTDWTANWLSNRQLPGSLPSLSSGISATVSQYWFLPAEGSFRKMTAYMDTLTRVDVSPVPEPGTWAMLLAGLGILGLSSRRKRA
ncbi:PEPxxWA-CTERM sorting domain-containing protein [Massilia sp. CCM 8734]|uniref:PEPxxWA-CTERM sorting domain-containing protein n=1 Tax=Massilia sp. CCM 8734 TaxID=2609283 RepID=UPI001E417BB7|nr:PEPxxWA-CTERM sorting domain-containing protein [Massilia sp. CCM 8734]